MSGGSLDYFYCKLDEHVGDFNDYELDELVKDLVKLFHNREWFLSGDTCEGSWNEARDEFKKKWFGDPPRKERIEQYLANLAEDVRRSLGISEKYCKNCMHWKNSEKHRGVYGDCKIHTGVLWHRSEHCELFETKNGGGGNDNT